MATGRLFDAYLMVDWSAAGRPRLGRDSIWLAERCSDEGTTVLENLPTRAAAVERLRARLVEWRAAGRRVLVGFDFPFGYPVGTSARVAGVPGWRPLWDWIAARLEDGPDNDNNRYRLAEAINATAFDGAGPFWGHPHQHRYAALPMRRPDGYGTRYPAERRLVERRVRSAHVVWKLVGNGQVGGQVLTGLPAVRRLRDDPALAGGAAVWPFEGGHAPSDLPPLLLAEIYPSLETLPEGDAVKDARQVRAVVEALEAADVEGRLAAMIAAPWSLPEAERRAVLEEEAWILNRRPEAGASAR
jgi:precorrin-8X/cobalt-precorrin-8 methylmutase